MNNLLTEVLGGSLKCSKEPFESGLSLLRGFYRTFIPTSLFVSG